MQFTYEEIASPEAFCGALKAAREERGISLATIAESTKISIGLLTALERADLRHWPKGIFRRSFFREYVRAIGVPVDVSVAAFKRFFPDGTEPPAATAASIDAAAAPMGPELAIKPPADDQPPAVDRMRLTLAPASPVPVSGWRAFLMSIADAVIAAATAFKHRLAASAASEVASVAETAAVAEPAAAGDDHGWVTDARRVPEMSPAMRVRIYTPRSSRSRGWSRVTGASIGARG